MSTITTCEHCADKFPDQYCEECRKKYEEPRSKFVEAGTEVWLVFSHHLRPQIFAKTLLNFLVYPGRSIHESINNNYTTYMKPFQYFALGFMTYGCFNNYLFLPQNWHIGIADRVSLSMVTFFIVALAVTAWTFSALGQVGFFDIFFCLCYIFGTAYLMSIIIDPILEVAKANPLFYNLRNKVNKLPEFYKIILSNIFIIIYLFFCLWDFFQFRRLSVMKYFITGFVASVSYAGAIYFVLSNNSKPVKQDKAAPLKVIETKVKDSLHSKI